MNEYASIGGQTSNYDLNGNLLTWYPPAGKSTYTYDSENRLVAAAVNASATPTISYDYDGLGRRSAKTVSGVTTTYLLDGDEEIAEYSGTTVLRRYITGPATDDRIAHAEGSATTTPTKTYYHVNHQGSVLAMTDVAGNYTGCATGTLCQRLAYDEYGNLSSGATGTGEPFQYTGRRYDVETGLYYYRARYYSPQLGRFLQTDPVGYKDDVDLYTYVGNDPTNRGDPSGTESACVTANAPCVDVAKVATAMAKVEKVAKAVSDNVTPSVSAKASAIAGPKSGLQVSATANAESISKGEVSVSVRSNGGGVALSASATANLDVGPKDIGDSKLTASVRAGMVGATVNVGEKGINGQIALGPQIGIQYKASSSPVSTGFGSSTTVDVGSYLQSYSAFVNASEN